MCVDFCPKSNSCPLLKNAVIRKYPKKVKQSKNSQFFFTYFWIFLLKISLKNWENKQKIWFGSKFLTKLRQAVIFKLKYQEKYPKFGSCLHKLKVQTYLGKNSETESCLQSADYWRTFGAKSQPKISCYRVQTEFKLVKCYSDKSCKFPHMCLMKLAS